MRRTEQLQGLRLMKFEEVYGRSYRGELSQVEASEIPGGLGADLPALAGSLSGGGGGGFVRPAPGPGFGAARRGRRGAGRAGAVRHALLGFHGQALLGEVGGRARGHAQLQLAAHDLAGARADQGRRRGAGRTDASGRAGRWWA